MSPVEQRIQDIRDRRHGVSTRQSQNEDIDFLLETIGLVSKKLSGANKSIKALKKEIKELKKAE